MKRTCGKCANFHYEVNDDGDGIVYPQPGCERLMMPLYGGEEDDRTDPAKFVENQDRSWCSSFEEREE